MIEVTAFFTTLKESMEQHADRLKKGRIFLPQYLKGRRFTKALHPIAATLARRLNLKVEEEVANSFLKKYRIGDRQQVDFVFAVRRDEGVPLLFLEVESLGGAQLYQFCEHRGINKEENCNKLWYYYETLANHFTAGQRVPRYFVWLLILPDCRIERSPYQWWDANPNYKFIHPSLKELVCQSPYRFYDHLIKTSARLFIEKYQDFLAPWTNGWVTKGLRECQEVCELVFITCTIDRLIMSRGKDFFDPNQEVSVPLNW
jgi:hypothetical protein